MIQSLIGGFQKMGGTNLETASTTWLAETTTEPVASATRAVIKVPPRGYGACGNTALFLGYGVGNANTTFRGTMVGWKLGGAGIYVPFPLWRALFTLGAQTGASGGLIGTGAKWADTIAATGAGYLISAGDLILSPADDTVASIRFDYCGCSYLELIGDLNSSATSFNGCLSFMD